MHTKTSNQSSKAWRAIAAFCVLVMLTLLPTSSFATVKSFRVANKNNTNVTHQWTFEGSSPLNDKKGIANGQMWPLGSSPWLEDGYNGADSKGLRLGGGVNNAGTNGIITVNGNAAGNPNAVYLTTNYAFEIIFRADEANSSSPNLGGVDKLSWLLCARSDDNTRRGYFLFQGEIGTLAGNGSGLGSIIGSSFGNIANGNRVATSLVAGHWYYVAGSYDTDLTAGTTTQTHYIADLTAGETTLTVVGPVTTPPGSTAPKNESVRFGIGTRYDGYGTTSQFNVEQVDLYTSNKMDQAHFQAQLTELLKAPHEVAIGGELIVDLNINRGLMLDINPVGGLPNGAYYWTNYGTARGEFRNLPSPPFQTGRTNPLTYQVSGGSNSVYTVSAQGFESTFTMPTTVSGQSAGVGKPYTAEVWFWPNRYRANMDRVLCFGTDPTASAACIIGYGNGRGMENGGGAGVVNWTGQSAADNARWYHMVNTYDGTTSILYTNGVEMGRNTINLNIADNRKMLLGTGNQGDPNYNNTVISAIGGFMAARVHSQALTPAQVLNNFQVGDQVPVINITVQNLAVTAVDIHSATVNGNLTVTTDPSTTGLTVYYGPTDQGSSKVGWAGSVTLGAPQNTGAFSIPLTGLADNTAYKCRIYGMNDNGEGWSGVQSFTTPPQAPAILNVSSRGQPNAVFVTWDRPMNVSAINYENYELNGPLIFSATFSSGNTVVKLITETLAEGTTYTLTANNSQDLALGLPVVPNTQKTFKHGEGYGLQAPITMKRYDGIGGTAVANLTGAAAYPNSPTSTNTTLTQMRIPQDVADNYGWWMYGYFVAPESGNYNFHTASDDASQVWITVGGVRTKVSEETGCCGGPKATITPVNLVAGQAYLLEQLGKEGGGGDHGWVSVMSPNNLFGYLGDGNGASLAIPSSAFAQTRIGSGTPFSTLGLVFFPLPPSNHTSLVGVDYTFAATLDGTPPYSTPQWFRNGELIPGATTLSYTAAAIPANSGAVYTLMVTGVCNIASASATFTVLSDTFPPTLVSATPGPLIGGNYVDILFSEAVETGSATESLNYEINGGALNVISATQLAPNKIRLTTDAQTRGASYAVVVNSVVDLFANTIAANSTVYFSGANFPGGVAPVVWFDASQITGLNDNDTVNTWNDSSGNNYTASGANGQRTYVTGQLNGHPVVQLRGDGFFNLTGNLLAREQYVVVRLPGGGDWGSYLGSDIRSGYMARQDGRFWNENYPDGVKQNGVNFAGAQNEGITLPNPASYMILKITGSTRNNGATARTGWHIGKQEGWQSLNMDLAEILAFDRPLSLAEEARVSKSLGNKYGIALPYTDVLEVGSRGIATTVYVSYLDPMDSVTAGDAGNYELNGPLVLGATVIDSTTVRLDVEAMADGSTHTLTITGVRKASPGNPFIAPNPSVVSFKNNFPPGGVSLGMVAWFDASRITGLADGNNVATWNDSSGNNRHASRGNGTITYSVNQVNGKPSVIFRGDPWMDLGGSSMRAHEQYIVFRTPNQGDWGAMLGSQVRGEYMMRRDGKFWDQNTPAQVKQNGVQLSNLTADNATPNIGTYMIMKIKGNNNYTDDRGGWKLGKQEGWQSLDMDLAEIVAFNRELSFVEEAKVSAALGAKYGIGTPDYADVLTVSSRGNPNAVYVSYLDAMDPATAGDPGNYDLGAGPLVLGATMLDATTVRLTVETMPDTYQTYTLNINGVKKATLAYISPNPTAKQFTHGKGYESYGLTLKRYMNIQGVSVSDLTANANFPGNPTDTSSPIKMEIPTDVADNYGWWMYGLYIAPATGNYVFHTSSDDHSQVWLSTDENPANKVKVSEQGGWNGSRQYQGGNTVSLVQGQKYYLEMLGKEGGGGDNGAVAAETPGNIYGYNGNGSEPIPASAFYAAGHRYGGVSFVTLGDVFFAVQPTNATVVDGYPLQMISVVDGTPPYYFQWSTNGTPIPGATNATYATLANHGLQGVQFSVCVSNEFSGTCSTNATIFINSDLIAPTLVSAKRKSDLTHVILQYSEAMEGATAGELTNYEISGGISVTGASMIDATNVLLTTSAQTPGVTYTVTVNDVRDDSSNHNPILAGASANFRAFPLVNPTYGTVLREFYANAQGNLDTYRDSSESFKNNPSNVAFQNNWNWGGCCDNYVVRLSGYIIPPVSGDYTFRVSRDDDARLFISTDETQANKGNPLINVGCCGDENTAPIALVADTAYYVEAWVREWGGGDYLRVFWKNGTTIPIFSEMDGNNIAYDAAAVVTQNPVDASVLDTESVTFTANGVVTGSGHGPAFQWERSTDNGISFSPISGATSASYVHNAAASENGYQYRCVARADDGVNSATTTAATLTVSADVTRPTVVRVIGYDNKIKITFSEAMSASAGELVQYDSAELSILSAVILNPTTIELTTSPQVNGNTYHVDIFGVTDTSLHLINPDPTHATFTTAPAPGGVLDGIVAWFDASTITGVADGGTVTTWTDMSSFARLAVRQNGLVTYAANQMGCLPTVKFRNDAWSDIGGPDFFSKEQYIVFRTVDNGDWGSVLGSQSRSGYLLNRNGHFWDGNYPQGVRRNGEAPLSPNFQLPNNGRDFMVLKITGNSSDSNPRGGWKLGKQEGWQSLGMDLAEVIAYNRVLTVDEENAVGAYLTKKYKLNTAYAALPPDALVKNATIPALGNSIIVCRNITIGVPYGTVPSSLAPEFTLSDGATIAPLSGTTRNFTTPQHYIVTSSDSQVVNDYTVTVVVAPAPPGGVGAGLVAWFDASLIPGVNPGGSVGIWPDQSGNNRDASIGGGTMTLAGNQVNGRPAVVFRGNAFAPLAGSNMRAHEQYIVFRFPNSGDWGSFLGSESQAEYMIRRDGMFWNGNVPAGVKQNGVVFPNPTENNFLSNIGQYMILKITGNNNDVNDRGNWRLGRQQGWSSLDMDVAEIIAYNRELNGTEEAAVGSYLLCKYGINATYPDPCPPTLLGAAPNCDRTKVSVSFSEAMTAVTTAELLNYTIANSSGANITINSATMNGTKGVILTLAGPLPVNQSYVVVVNGATDLAGNPLAANSSAGFTAVPCTEIAGSLFREIYTGIGGNNIEDLWNSASFIAGNPNIMNMRDIFQTYDYGNDNYGIRMTGVLIPSESGNYQFRLHTDDQGRVFLSTDENQANKTLLVAENGCCGYPESGVVALTAGQAYYVEAYMKEGGGGDYLELMWRNNGAIPNYSDITSPNLAYRYSLTINQNPANQTVAPGNNVTFTVGAVAGGSAIVKKYQWQKSVDYGASFQVIPGATSASYTKLVGGGDNNSQYRCEVHLLGNFQTNVSAAAILNPFPDTTPPTLLSAEGEAGGTSVLLTFDEGVIVGSAEEILNYTIVSAAGCELSVNAALRESPTRVRLTTSVQTPGAHYVVHANGLQDLSPNANVMTVENTASFTGKVLPAGTVVYYSFNADGSDGSGNNSHLVTENGNPQFVAQGRFGGGLYLDGNSTLKKVGFPTGVPTGGNPYTVAFFTKAEGGVCGAGGWIGYGQANNQNLANNFRLNGINSIWNYWYSNDRGATLPAGDFQDGWHSVVGTWDGTSRRLYLDGVLLDDNEAGNGLNVIADQFVIGRTLNDCNFKGWMDELLIVNRAMTPGEITAFNTGGAGAVPDTTAPVIACNTNRSVTTGNPLGANVTFSTTATDNSGCAAVVCAPASGSLFPLGVTTVNCHAYDANLNTNTCSFTVTVNLSVPPVPTTVTSSSFSGGAFNMSFGTVNGLTYYVECAVTLDGSVQGAGVVWQAVETISGDGQPRNVSYPQNGATKRFYRIRIQ